MTNIIILFITTYLLNKNDRKESVYPSRKTGMKCLPIKKDRKCFPSRMMGRKVLSHQERQEVFTHQELGKKCLTIIKRQEGNVYQSRMMKGNEKHWIKQKKSLKFLYKQHPLQMYIQSYYIVKNLCLIGHILYENTKGFCDSFFYILPFNWGILCCCPPPPLS